MGDSHIGLQARLMSQGLRKLVGLIKKNNCIVIFINQLREKVGVMFGSPETTPGGRALKFYSSVRLDVRKIDSIKQGENVVGNRTRVKVIKNKVAPPFKQAEFDIMYGKGIDRIGVIIDIGVKENIITKSGSWFSYGEERLGLGREKGKEYLKENPEILKKIESQLYEKINSKSNEKVEENINTVQGGQVNEINE
jgi:recombination protein RecA